MHDDDLQVFSSQVSVMHDWTLSWNGTVTWLALLIWNKMAGHFDLEQDGWPSWAEVKWLQAIFIALAHWIIPLAGHFIQEQNGWSSFR